MIKVARIQKVVHVTIMVGIGEGFYKGFYLKIMPRYLCLTTGPVRIAILRQIKLGE